ncbi:MAG: methyl-accepting chemotaxis protein [Anaerovibrio sp.]|uniref:methyl-accepting chemotaxis protein n=1 Tax=Anaerovibrio sp. TaxID=1872532 RepID=UPI0025E9A60F|nr:methyl-accepting chemotaxis protein [Anaerovibrio sp.]MCR5176407.1 methyl-accepting chemotaxis protein [Anaerovibrio sp.]
MSIKRKFQLFAVAIGVLMLIISAIGYVTADSNLEESVESELVEVVHGDALVLDGWCREKGAVATYAANLLTSYNGDITRIEDRNSLSLISSDKEILDLGVGRESDVFIGYNAGNITGKFIPKERPWYKDVKKAGKTIFTDPYVDKITGKLIVSVTSPYYINGNFDGAVCADVALDVVSDQAKAAKYRGEVGEGIVIDAKGSIMGTSKKEDIMTDIRQKKGIGEHFDEMLNNDSGYFFYENDEGKQIFGYSKMPTTGWIFGLSVPYEYVFSTVRHLQLIYGIVTLIGFIIVVAMCLWVAGQITGPIIALEEHAEELARGNLRVQDVQKVYNDEIGQLVDAFNKMRGNITKLIKSMSQTAEQVAASSEELTANTQQGAEASVHVAETVSQVSGNMERQISDVNAAKESVDVVYNDIEIMTKKANEASDASRATAEAAREGSELMKNAITKMGLIENSVSQSAEVVRTLGENSKQIGQIVEAISSIAEQTNLLSLNAAIEAARAGEQGRGFAVVAEEVRKLATESKESAEQIKNRISSIQENTDRAVESMEQGTKEVEQGTKAIRDVGEQFNDILNKVNSIGDQMDEINHSVKTVSEGAGRIVSAVDAIDTVSKETAEHMTMIAGTTQQQSASNQEIAAASHALAEMATDMNGIVGEFKV